LAQRRAANRDLGRFKRDALAQRGEQLKHADARPGPWRLTRQRGQPKVLWRGFVAERAPDCCSGREDEITT
jgi:hypothetical protein